MQIGVIGSAGPEEYPKRSMPNKKIYRAAERLGELIAEKGAFLITGGKGGIMKAASKGAKNKGGITVGIVKGNKRNVSNKFVDIEIVSNTSGGGEEAILVQSCDGIIVVGGGAGTLQELAYAYRNSKPIVAISNVKGYGSIFAGKYLDDRKIVKIKQANSPENALELLMKSLE